MRSPNRHTREPTESSPNERAGISSRVRNRTGDETRWLLVAGLHSRGDDGRWSPAEQADLRAAARHWVYQSDAPRSDCACCAGSTEVDGVCTHLGSRLAVARRWAHSLA